MRSFVGPLALLTLAACAPREAAPPAAPPEAVYTATEFAFSGPDTLAPGYTSIRFRNQGTQEHHLILGQLPEGQTLADFQAAMQANPNAEPALTWRGAAGAILPGDSTGSTINLVPGRYLALCFVSDPADQTMHIMKGMVKEVVVAGEPNGAPAPVAATEIRLHDFGFTVPPTTAGVHTFHVVNDGPQSHEAQLVRLDDGATAEQFLAAFAPGATAPPPGHAVGGSGALSTGLDNYWTVALTPGNYLLLCFVPDSTDGMPHVMKGMSQAFSIPAS